MKRLTAISLALTAFAVSSIILLCSCSHTSANIKSAAMTTFVTEEGEPADEVRTYPAGVPELIVFAHLYNAPKNTMVTFVWSCVSDSSELGMVRLDSGEKTNRYLFSYLTNEMGWPKGDYRVAITIGNRSKPDAVVNFKVR